MIKKYSTDLHAIYHSDVLDALKLIPDASVDLIFADPPYNIGKNFDGLHDKIAEDTYFQWCCAWIDECGRILKSDGSIYLMNSTQNMPFIDMYCRANFEILSRIVWAYDSSGVQAKSFFGSLYEPILHMVKDKKNYTFNSNAILVEAKTGAKRALINYRKDPPEPYSTTKVPGNVWEFPRVRFRMEEYENHPSQKPEALLERVILASSNENDIVLDPFAGSFSTAAVAKRLGRRSISIEQSEAYVKIGLRRVGVPSHYSKADLMKEKPRTTKNLSKKDRGQVSVEQTVLELELQSHLLLDADN